MQAEEEHLSQRQTTGHKGCFHVVVAQDIRRSISVVRASRDHFASTGGNHTWCTRPSVTPW